MKLTERGRQLPNPRAMWDSAAVKLWLAIRGLLPIFAILGLVLAPLTTPVAAAGWAAPMQADAHAAMAGMADHEGGMADDMPCCPPETPALPDCQKACPLAALCMAKCIGGMLGLGTVPLRMAVAEVLISRDELAPESLPQAPPPRPPQS